MKDKKALAAAIAAIGLYLEAERVARPSPWRISGRREQHHRDPRARRGRGIYERPKP
ncbi:MAG: hypothetical protein ABIG98_02685 [Chloroflexota bacterium]